MWVRMELLLLPGRTRDHVSHLTTRCHLVRHSLHLLMPHLVLELLLLLLRIHSSLLILLLLLLW
jgi:hypothetical protein